MSLGGKIIAILKLADYLAGEKCPYCGDKSAWRQHVEEQGWWDKFRGQETITCNNCKRTFKIVKE